MELPSATTRTLAEVNCRLCDVATSSQNLSSPACPDILIHSGQNPSIDPSIIAVRSPAGVWPQDYTNTDGTESDRVTTGSSLSLQTITKPALDHITMAMTQLRNLLVSRIIAPFEATTHPSPSLAWHPHQPLLATVDSQPDSSLQIFNFSGKIPYLGQQTQNSVPPLSPSITLKHELQHGACSGAVAWRPTHSRSVAVGCSRGVYLWHNVTESSVSGVWLQSPGGVAVHALCWHPRGNLLAGASRHRPGFFLWDVATGVVTPIRAGLENVTLLRWSPCGCYLFAGGKAGSFRIWETVNWTSAKWALGGGGSTTRAGSSSSGELVGAEWSPDGRTLLLAHSHQVSALHLTADVPALTAQVLPVPLAELATASRSSTRVESVAWDPRGQRLAIALECSSNKEEQGPQSRSTSSSASGAVSSIVAIYDSRCDPILTARFIGYARVVPLEASFGAVGDGDWEMVEPEEEEKEREARVAVKDSCERVAMSFMPSFTQGAVLSRPTLETEVPRLDPDLDDELSKRPLNLDAAGYYLIRIEKDSREIVSEYYTNIINKNGLACDPDTGEVIPCTPDYVRPPTRIYRGKTAKEISVQILEVELPEGHAPVCTHLEHANYLGREFQRAEFALLLGQDYVQD